MENYTKRIIQLNCWNGSEYDYIFIETNCFDDWIIEEIIYHVKENYDDYNTDDVIFELINKGFHAQYETRDKRKEFEF